MRLMALSLTLVLLAGATVAGAYTATTGTVPAQDPTMENPEPTDGIVDGGDGQDPWTMDMTQLHYAQDYIIGIKIVAQHKSGGAAGLPAVQYTAETAEHRTSEPFQAALTEALGDFWANYDASQWQILSATVTEVAGPFTEPTAALLTQFYEEDNLRYLSAVADKAEDADMTGLIERAFDERKDSYFSVLIGSLKSPQDFSELAMRAYEQQRVAALTIVAEYTKAETLREIVYRAFDERRTAELAVLMDEVSIYYEEIADRMLANPSGATSVLSVVAENIPTEKADEIGKLLYERNDISSFTIIMDIMSAEAREQVLEKATADKNVTFQSVLAW